MATVLTPQTTFNRAEADRRVRHPLRAIRGYIFRYVLVEGIALTVLFVAVCFWLGLALDFLPWTLFSFDWLYSFDEATGGGPSVVFRVAVLIVLGIALLGVVAFKILFRLFREFSDSAVALLLERRFPKELGDRLITAVEMADPKLSEKYGYSQAMIDLTIRDAAERVERLPVHEIFRWGRLRLKVVLALFATVGMYLLVGLTWCGIASAAPGDFLVRFHHTASIWTERNLLVQDSYWPPNTLIELIRFPGNELRVPREEDRPDVKVRAIRWAIADGDRDSAPRGWRALRYSDLKDVLPAEMLDIKLPQKWGGWIVDLDDLKSGVPAGAVPPEWGWQGATSGHVWRELEKDEVKQILDRGSAGKDAPNRTALYETLDWRNWTVDKIELQLQYTDPKARKKTVEAGLAGPAGEVALLHRREQPVASAMMAHHKADYDKFLAILLKLEELAEDPAMARTLRKMEDADEVVAQRKSKSGGGTTNCTAIGGRKFLFPLGELKESCQFSIATQDYWTPWRQITLVPPPAIDQFRIDKDEPAYLYYRMPENPALLKNKRQKISSVNVSTSGAYTQLVVPLGTHLAITGHSDRELKDIRVAEPDPKKREEKTSITVPAFVQLGADRKSFTCSFADVQRVIEFDFEFKDLDGVKGSRRVIIMPLVDQAPRINELNLAISPRVLHATDEAAKGIAAGPRYVVTPDAYLKWRGKVEDDRGLAKLEYRYELQEIDFQNIFADASDSKAHEPKGPDPKRPTRGVGAEIAAGGLIFVPGPSAYGFYAVGYYGGLTQIVKDGMLPPPPPRTDTVGLQRSKLWLNKRAPEDATPEELERLLTIQPVNRKLLLEALEFTPEKRTLTAFVERLSDANQTAGFLREVMDFAGTVAADAERNRLAASDPAEALAQVLHQLKRDPDQLRATRDLLEKMPEKKILSRYDLQDEDPAFGFDLREQLRYIKALGTNAVQKHYALRVSIVATDTNVDTGPGVTSAGLQYSFLIVSENELLSLMLVDQRKYYDLLYQAVQEMEKARGHLESQLVDYRRAPDDPVKLLIRAEAAKKALRDGGITTKAILTRFESVLKEMDFNRMDRVRIDKVKKSVADPLIALTAPSGLLPKTEEQAVKFYKELSPDADKKDKADMIQQGNDPELLKDLLSRKDHHINNADQTLTDISALIRELNKILDAISRGVDDDSTIELLVRIEAAHREVDLSLRRFQVEWRQHIQRMLIGDGQDKK